MPNMYKESVLLKLVPYLPAKLTRQLYILQNTSFQKKAKYLSSKKNEVYVCFMRNT